MDVGAVVSELESELSRVASIERATNEKRYLKSEIQHLGVNVPHIRKTARRFVRERRDIEKSELRSLVSELWSRRVYELRKLAVDILASRPDVVDVVDIDFVEVLMRNSHTWALIDDIALNVVPSLLETVEDAQSIRHRWSADDDFWVRRASMLSLLPKLKRGTDGWDEFAGYASGMLHEMEFFIQKAIGWVLREVSKHSPDLVAEWMQPRAEEASSVTFREATKYLSIDQQSLLTRIRRST